MDNPYALPSFWEDPVLYDDNIVTYIEELQELGDTVTLASTKKPSLSDYDGVVPE
jgi:hypothetical protein